MAFTHGSKALFKVGSSATPTVVQDVSTYGNSVGAHLSRDTAETTTFGKTSKTYIPGLKDATIPFDGPFDPTCDGIFWDLYNTGAIVNFEYYPSGTGTGNIKFSGTCLITAYEVSSGVSSENTAHGEFQVSGDVTRTVL